MALTDTSYPERVVIVLNADGSFKGAHQEKLRTIADGGAIISTMMAPAEPLDAATLANVLPNQAALAAQVQGLNDQLTAAVAAKDAALASKSELESQVTSLQSQLTQARNPAGLIDGIPQQVSNYQARSALITAGLFDRVDATVKALGSGSVEYQAWEYANVYSRTSPFIVSMGTQLGLSTAEIDALFVIAAQVV